MSYSIRSFDVSVNKFKLLWLFSLCSHMEGHSKSDVFFIFIRCFHDYLSFESFPKFAQAEDGVSGTRKPFVTFVLGNKVYNNLLIPFIIADIRFDDPDGTVLRSLVFFCKKKFSAFLIGLLVKIIDYVKLTFLLAC